MVNASRNQVYRIRLRSANRAKNLTFLDPVYLKVLSPIFFEQSVPLLIAEVRNVDCGNRVIRSYAQHLTGVQCPHSFVNLENGQGA